MSTDDRFTRTELEMIARALELAQIVGQAITQPGYATAAGMLRRKVQAMAADTEATEREQDARRRVVESAADDWRGALRREERARGEEIERARRIARDASMGGDDDAA